MTTTAELYDTINKSGALFNVRRERMYSESGAASDKFGIVNDYTNEVIGIVSEGYKVLTNDEVIRSMLASFDKSAIDLTDAAVEVKANSSGSRSMVNIVLPAYSVLAGPNETNLQISALNSYDGKFKYMSKAGGLRLKCLNGNILGKIVSSYSGYHNARLDVEIGSQHMLKMIAEFSKSQDWFNALMAKPVTTEEVLAVAARFFNVKAEDLKDYRPWRKLSELIDGYFKEMGQNAYALYNALSDFVSHRKRSDKALVTSLLNDEKAFALVLNNEQTFAV
jgi:hypothetical protein